MRSHSATAESPIAAALVWAFDTWFLRLFPADGWLTFSGGGYATLSFIPTLGTMILGLLAGSVMKSDRTAREKMTRLLVAGWRKPAVRLVVIGTNSTAAYMIAHLFEDFIRGALRTHFGAGRLRRSGPRTSRSSWGAPSCSSTG